MIVVSSPTNMPAERMGDSQAHSSVTAGGCAGETDDDMKLGRIAGRKRTPLTDGPNR